MDKTHIAGSNIARRGTATKQAIVSEEQDHSRRSLPKLPLMFARKALAGPVAALTGHWVQLLAAHPVLSSYPKHL